MNKELIFKNINVDIINKNIYICEFSMKHTKSVTIDFLNDLNNYVNYLIKINRTKKEKLFFIMKGTKDVFNLGGDLKLFLNVIENNKRSELESYSYLCIDIIYKIMSFHKINITSIAVINGEARGGGLEAALSCDIIIGVKGYKTSFPETKMGFFPGMGAFENLSKRIGVKDAKKFILNGDTYLTEELFDLKIIDYIFEKDDFEINFFKLIKLEERNSEKNYNLRIIENRLSSITKGELLDSVNLWCDNIFNLKKIDIRTIKKIIIQQDKNN